MRTENVKKALLYIFILVVLFVITVKITIDNIDVNSTYYRLYDRLVDSIAMELVIEKSMPTSILKQESKSTTLIYVLGGNQDSLISRFRKASILYHQGLSNRILILSRPGITEFNPKLGRNLTNDEWSTRELEGFNVRKEDIEPVSVQKSLLGTLSEAKKLSDIVRNRGCTRLILVTSYYHTRRVYNTFFRSTSEYPLEIYIYGSNDPISLRILLSEYIKLFLYDIFPILER
jgi:hypothetical protein